MRSAVIFTMVVGLIATVALPAYAAFRPEAETMTLQQAAVVKSLAQIEMLFTMASSAWFFREKINRLEIAGCCLIVSGIVVLMIVR